MLGPYYVNNEPRRIAAWGQPCQIPWGTITLFGKNFKVHAATVPVWQAFEVVREKYGYVPTGTDTGFYNCRHMRHDPKLPWSAHAWATALDLNWLQNPAGSKLVTDMPPAMIRELQGIKTESGVYVFMWGGDWDRDLRTGHSYYDAMHWEVIAHPKDIETGIVLPPGSPEIGDNMGLRAGMRGGAVKALQIHLNSWDPSFALELDGVFGSTKTDGGRTGACLAVYQEAAGLRPNPLHADDTTLALLMTNALRNPKTLANLIGGK